MISMDAFKTDPFSATSLLAALDKLDYTPSFLGSIPGLFDPVPVRTMAVWIEDRTNSNNLIQTTERGAPPKVLIGEDRNATPFKTFRLAEKSRIHASELANIRAFGSETETKQLTEEVARRLARIRSDMELTKENLRLGTVLGLTTDADGTTLYDWAAEFGQTIPAEVDFDLDAASPVAGVLRGRVTTAVRSMTRALKGLGGNGVRFWAICGDEFWDALIAHVEVRATYLGWTDAARLRDPVAWESFLFGGVMFTNYRGTDNGTTVAVGSQKCKFFPVGAGIFKWAMSPGETFSDLNGVGRPEYPRIYVDPETDEWADVLIRTYPLPVNTMPSALYRARMT